MDGPSDEEALVRLMADCCHDPLKFVLAVFDWGEGELAGCDGPNAWQAEILAEIRDGLATPGEAIRIAVASGHGVGKSALVAWLILWALATFEDTRGVVTANTEAQLRTKTWAELVKWHRRCLVRSWFVLTATALHAADPEHEKTWRVDRVAWSERNTEAFAGLHNQGKRLLVVFDEASAIPDAIWEVTEGALTDAGTEIVWFTPGSPTRNSGRFRACFGSLAHRWRTRQIDSRTVPRIVNRRQIDQWVEDYGEESDFVRVRVRGVFPRASDLQFIDSESVAQAMTRPELYGLADPLIMGIDIARGGGDSNAIVFRRGMSARVHPILRIPGALTRDTSPFIAKVATLIQERRPDAVFVDATGVGGPLVDRLRQLGFAVTEVQFSWQADDRHYANKRAEMWARMKGWLRLGGAIPNDPALEAELTTVEYSHNARDQLLLEAKEDMKARHLGSPDAADGLALTFAFPVAPRGAAGSGPAVTSEYDPYA